ncbi:MAG: DNA alkylation repair protein [Fibrobacter sp.]|nr:DNA alkylation repair protein [Fibrobacter sp.]
MWHDGLFEVLEKEYDQEQSQKMSAYMKNMFEFLGIPKPRLTELTKPYYKACKKEPFDWNFVSECWKKTYREEQYVGIGYMKLFASKFTDKDLPKLEYFITHKSWWETVDSIDEMVGIIVMKYTALEKTMLEWSVAENMWLRRVAIDFQQRFKEKTNTKLLEKILCSNFGSSEFFINKAIGWSLREYSKVNPEWVRKFIEKNENSMSKLSVREGSKYI